MPGRCPFSLLGGIWFLYVLDYDLSVAVGVGFIALAGVSAEIGVIMLTYLDMLYFLAFSTWPSQRET